MKRYLNHSILALSVLTLAGLLIHVNNSSSVAHASWHVDSPIVPSERLTDSLRTVSGELDREIASLNAEELALRDNLCMPVESSALYEWTTCSVDEDLPDNRSDAYQIASRIQLQEEYIRSLSELVDQHRAMSARVPVLTPVNGVHTSGFGLRVHPITGVLKGHTGMDIAAQRGTPIHVSGSGVVVFAGVRHGYGNVVEVDHGFGYHTLYGHSSQLLVKAGDSVERGQTIALVGSTGMSTGPHLHYEVIVDGTKIDPSPFLIQPLDGPASAVAEASAHSGWLTAFNAVPMR